MDTDDDRLRALLRGQAPEVEDDGFTARVMAQILDAGAAGSSVGAAPAVHPARSGNRLADVALALWVGAAAALLGVLASVAPQLGIPLDASLGAPLGDSIATWLPALADQAQTLLDDLPAQLGGASGQLPALLLAALLVSLAALAFEEA